MQIHTNHLQLLCRLLVVELRPQQVSYYYKISGVTFTIIVTVGSHLPHITEYTSIGSTIEIAFPADLGGLYIS